MARTLIGTIVVMFVLTSLLSADEALLLIILGARELRQWTWYIICGLIERGYANEFRAFWKIKDYTPIWFLLRLFNKTLMRSEDEFLACHPSHAGNATASYAAGERPKNKIYL